MGPNEAVVAGSPEFVDAMLPVFTERFGGAPRVADSPHLASALCQDGARLLVYEHGGREWLSLCADLRGVAGPDLVVVVALPPEHAGDIAQISSSASAVVAWRGEVAPVLEAASRVLVARDAPPPPARRTGPVLTPPPKQAVARPSPTPPRPPAAAPPPRPVMTPSPRPAATPARPAPVAPPPDRVEAQAEVPVAVAATVRSSPPPAPGAAVPGADPFDAIFDEEAAARPPPPAEGTAPPPSSVPSALAVWPATVLSAVDGQAVVRAALSGLWPEQRLRATTEKVVASLSTAEKGATMGQKLPFDPLPVRRAVGLRWQVAAALDTLPSHGAQVDQPAVHAILGGIDEVLADLKTLSDDASPETLRAIEAVRHALVKEAIDLTEALQQVLPAEMVEEVTTSRKGKRGDPAGATRMIYSTGSTGAERRQAPWGLVVLLVLAVAGAAAYHGYRYVNRPKQAASTISGAPSGSVGTATAQGKIVVAPVGTKVDPKELENFRNLEKAKGNEVREVLPGTFVVTPEGARAGKPPGAGGTSTQGAKP